MKKICILTQIKDRIVSKARTQQYWLKPTGLTRQNKLSNISLG